MDFFLKDLGHIRSWKDYDIRSCTYFIRKIYYSFVKIIHIITKFFIHLPCQNKHLHNLDLLRTHFYSFHKLFINSFLFIEHHNLLDNTQ